MSGKDGDSKASLVRKASYLELSRRLSSVAREVYAGRVVKYLFGLFHLSDDELRMYYLFLRVYFSPDRKRYDGQFLGRKHLLVGGGAILEEIDCLQGVGGRDRFLPKRYGEQSSSRSGCNKLFKSLEEKRLIVRSPRRHEQERYPWLFGYLRKDKLKEKATWKKLSLQPNDTLNESLLRRFEEERLSKEEREEQYHLFRLSSLVSPEVKFKDARFLLSCLDTYFDVPPPAESYPVAGAGTTPYKRDEEFLKWQVHRYLSLLGLQEWSLFLSMVGDKSLIDAYFEVLSRLEQEPAVAQDYAAEPSEAVRRHEEAVMRKGGVRKFIISPDGRKEKGKPLLTEAIEAEYHTRERGAK
ncbi:hypothetical protein JXA12_04700 [Candidatus Woesearchaeota archaeon]|nr:hypothetical protein [Candidatus Woesearchaeota archaeon]